MIFRGKQLFNSSFDDFAVNYDSIRPNYPKAFFNDIQENCISFLKKDASILEVGTGTGNATKDLAKFQIPITSIEPGKNLLKIAKNKFRNNKNIRLINETFENFKTSKKFNIVFSATTFHWIDEAKKFNIVNSLLKKDGVLILAWNNFCRDNSNIYEEIDLLYIKYLNEIYPKQDVNIKSINKLLKREREISKSGLFYIDLSKKYITNHYYDGKSYARLLNTFPKIIKLKKETREKFLKEVIQTIDNKSEKICVPIITSLYICRKIEDLTNFISS